MANNVTPASLRIIRLALLGGVLLFGAVIAFLHSRGELPSRPTPLDQPIIAWVFFGLCVGAAAVIVVLRGMAERAPAFEKQAGLVIAAWASGESVALLGAVHWFLTGRPTLFLVGLAVFVVGLVTVAVPER